MKAIGWWVLPLLLASLVLPAEAKDRSVKEVAKQEQVDELARRFTMAAQIVDTTIDKILQGRKVPLAEPRPNSAVLILTPSDGAFPRTYVVTSLSVPVKARLQNLARLRDFNNRSGALRSAGFL